MSPLPRLPPPSIGRVRRHRIGPGVRFGAVFGELDRHLRAAGADDRVGDAVARVGAEVRVQVALSPMLATYAAEFGLTGRVRDFLVERVVARGRSGSRLRSLRAPARARACRGAREASAGRRGGREQRERGRQTQRQPTARTPVDAAESLDPRQQVSARRRRAQRTGRSLLRRGVPEAEARPRLSRRSPCSTDGRASCEQRRAAVPAVGGAAAVHGTARAALPVHARLGGREQPLHLAELCVDLLQFGCFAREHVEAIVVADRHLVGEPAEIPGERGDALSELQPPLAQLGHRALGVGSPPAGSTTPPLAGGGAGAAPAARPASCHCCRSHSFDFDRRGASSLLSSFSCCLAGRFFEFVGRVGLAVLSATALSRVLFLRPVLRPCFRRFLFFFALCRAC